MKHGALINSLAHDDEAASGRVTEAELLGTIAERDADLIALASMPEPGAWTYPDGDPQTPISRLADRYPRGFTTAVLAILLLVWGLMGHGEPEAEAAAAELAEEIAQAEQARAYVQATLASEATQ